MAYTSTDLENICKAIASGKKSVRLNNRVVEYQSLTQMLAAKNDIQDSLNDASAKANGVRKPKVYRARYRSGY